MLKKPRIYLAGQPNEYEDNWKEKFKKLEHLDCYDWEFDSDQSSSDTFFPQDLTAVREADFLIANPGLAPSEATWIEVGYFIALNTSTPGEFCNKLIIIWKEERLPKWSFEFVRKTGYVAPSVEEAINLLDNVSEVKP
jgi:hypothetical protein